MTEISFKGETCQGKARLQDTENWTEFSMFIMTCDETIIKQIKTWMEAKK